MKDNYNDYIDIRIHKDDLLKMLKTEVGYKIHYIKSSFERLGIYYVFEAYYKKQIEKGVFANTTFNPHDIVETDFKTIKIFKESEFSSDGIVEDNGVEYHIEDADAEYHFEEQTLNSYYLFA